jgi:hypothetical protein
MFLVDDIILAEGLKNLRFCCDLSVCKGQCCIDGDLGAPLNEKEAEWINSNQDKYKHMMGEGELEEVKEQGWIIKEDGIWHTPLMGEAGPCVYLQQDQDGVLKCIFEILWQEGKIEFRKPLSCHLYPLLYKENEFHKVLTWQKRDLCRSCFDKGPLLVEFEKEALIRCFGEEITNKIIDTVKGM